MMKRARTLICAALVLAAASLTSVFYFQRATVHAEPSAEVDAHNAIDRFILQRLTEQKIQPSPLCSDNEFCRRVYLDVCGVIPTLDQSRAFIADKNPAKREKLIDALLASPRHGLAWSVLWADLLRDNTNSKLYHDWIRHAIRTNMPYDEFARRLIAASGNTDDNPAARFILRDQGNNVELVNSVATVFMGTRMACAQCHDHPFDKWTQDDFRSLMSFFMRTAVEPDPIATLGKIEADPEVPQEIHSLLSGYFEEAHREEFLLKQKSFVNVSDTGLNTGMIVQSGLLHGRDIIKDLEKRTTKENVEAVRKLLQKYEQRIVGERANGEYNAPTEGDGVKKGGGNEVVPAVFPWDSTQKCQGPGSRRKFLAEYVTGNRQFAKVQVNRIWAQVMGRGLVEPRDDFREKNPPSHPELLDFLTDQFIASKFDNKHMLRMMLNSDTYQRSSEPNSSNRADAMLFSHARIRRMSAEQFYDSILVAGGFENGVEDDPDDVPETPLTGPKPERKGKIRWAADINVPAPTGSFLYLLNQPDREQTVTQRDESASIPQVLELINGGTLGDAIRKGPLADALLNAKFTPAKALGEMYMSALSRTPTQRELDYIAAMNPGQALTREWLDDANWAILNMAEFSYINK